MMPSPKTFYWLVEDSFFLFSVASHIRMVDFEPIGMLRLRSWSGLFTNCKIVAAPPHVKAPFGCEALSSDYINLLYFLGICSYSADCCEYWSINKKRKLLTRILHATVNKSCMNHLSLGLWHDVRKTVCAWDVLLSCCHIHTHTLGFVSFLFVGPLDRIYGQIIRSN